MRPPRYVREYMELVHEIGLAAFVRQERKGSLLIGLGMVGRLSERPPSNRRRTLNTIEAAELRAVQSILDRVWRVRKDPRAKRSIYVSLGQSVDNDIVIPEYSVSTEHCAFGFDGLRVTIIDRGSLNGVKLDEQRIRPNTPVPLRDGMTVTLGRVKAQFLYGTSFVQMVTKLAASVAA